MCVTQRTSPHLNCEFPSSQVPVQAPPLTASMSRSVDLTGGNWGLRKRLKNRYRESQDWVGLTLLMRDASDPPLPPSTFIYTACMRKQGVQVQFSWVQLRRWQEQKSCGVLLFGTDYPDQVSVSCFSCKAVSLNLASPWLGPCLSPRGP
jgi:hypothetical protein